MDFCNKKIKEKKFELLIWVFVILNCKERGILTPWRFEKKSFSQF